MPQLIIERICRRLCKERQIDPDGKVSPLVPVYMNSLPVVNGFHIPPDNMICKAWELFEETVKIIFDELGIDEEELNKKLDEEE